MREVSYLLRVLHKWDVNQSKKNLCYALICADGVTLRDQRTPDGQPTTLRCIPFATQKRSSLGFTRQIELFHFWLSKFELQPTLAQRLGEP